MSSHDSPSMLIVDDDPDFTSLLRMILKSSISAEVTVAGDCASARESLDGSFFDIVTVDYELPDGNGIDLIVEITSQPFHPPVVMITGKGDEQTAARAFHVGASGYVVKDQKMKTMILSSIHSALEWSQTERALELERQQFIAVFDSMDQVVYASDPVSNEILYANKAARSQWGEIVGMKCYEALQNLAEPCPFCTNNIIFDPDREGEAYYWQFKNLVNNRWYQLVDKVIRWPDGRDIRLEIATDISTLKEVEEALRDLNVELKGFAYVVSHDLKSPIAAIGTAAGLIPQVLEGAVLPEDASSQLADLLKLIGRNVEKSNHLIESLLALAEAGQVPVEICMVDINAVVGEVVEEKAVETQALAASVSVTNDLGWVQGSPTHFYQLFANLIGNALIHSRASDLRVEITRLDDSSDCCYLVRDNGRGIPEENLEKIFMPFFTTKSGSGGIGLATVKRILEVYCGSITAYNDGGACFEFTIGDPAGPA